MWIIERGYILSLKTLPFLCAYGAHRIDAHVVCSVVPILLPFSSDL